MIQFDIGDVVLGREIAAIYTNADGRLAYVLRCVLCGRKTTLLKHSLAKLVKPRMGGARITCRTCLRNGRAHLAWGERNPLPPENPPLFATFPKPPEMLRDQPFYW